MKKAEHELLKLTDDGHFFPIPLNPKYGKSFNWLVNFYK